MFFWFFHYHCLLSRFLTGIVGSALSIVLLPTEFWCSSFKQVNFNFLLSSLYFCFSLRKQTFRFSIRSIPDGLLVFFYCSITLFFQRRNGGRSIEKGLLWILFRWRQFVERWLIFCRIYNINVCIVALKKAPFLN